MGLYEVEKKKGSGFAGLRDQFWGGWDLRSIWPRWSSVFVTFLRSGRKRVSQENDLFLCTIGIWDTGRCPTINPKP